MLPVWKILLCHGLPGKTTIKSGPPGAQRPGSGGSMTQCDWGGGTASHSLCKQGPRDTGQLRTCWQS